jgi:hypothetical protein
MIRIQAKSDIRKPFLVLEEKERGMREIKTPLTPHVRPARRL